MGECEFIDKEVVKPFDWTFTSEYKGTMCGDEFSSLIEQTDERIDLEKLKVKEKILFYDDVCLYEDELGDNGTSMLSVKIRCMPTSFFLLMIRISSFASTYSRKSESKICSISLRICLRI